MSASVAKPSSFFKSKMMEVSSSCHHTACTTHGSLSSESNHRRDEIMEKECLKRLKKDINISEHVIFRFACYHHFDYDEAFKDLQNAHKNRRLNLRMDEDMIQQFETKTLFPLPGLKTRRNCDVIYMKQSRYCPHEMKHSLIDSLCYLLNDMSRTKEQCRNGVAMIVNMEDWTMKNFSYDCSHLLTLVPTKVDLFLIVNAPPGFSNIWKLMKPMFSLIFAKKVHMIKEARLKAFLMDGYEQYLPDEFANGWKDTNELVEDLIDLKQYEDDQ